VSRKPMEKIPQLLEHFEHAMLVTRRDGDLRSRPMVIGDYTDDGRIRFITRDDSAKLAELDEHPQVNVALQGEARFLSISGRARASKDRDLIDRAWDTQQGTWFSEGKEDPHVTVLEVVPTYAEYWDRSADDLVQVVLDKAKDIAGDEGSASGSGEHGEVDVHDRPL